MWTGPEPDWRRKVIGGVISNPPKLICTKKDNYNYNISFSYHRLASIFQQPDTHRRKDRRFQGDERHFGLLPIKSEALHFHHVELILSLRSQTHLEQQHNWRHLHVSFFFFYLFIFYLGAEEFPEATKVQASRDQPNVSPFLKYTF